MGLADKPYIENNTIEDSEDDWSDEDWEMLLDDVAEEKCIPFIGQGASNKWIEVDQIVNEWSKKYNYPYPLGDYSMLPRVSQFIAIQKKDDTFPKKILSRIIEKKPLPDFSPNENHNNVYTVLADLNLPIYITTNYDHLMEKALKDRGKKPVTDFSTWKDLKNNHDEADVNFDPNYKPSSDRPLVFHLLGEIDTPESMVLTEKDYIDFAIYLTREGDKGVLPHSIRQKISLTTLLFVGYRLEDISFIIVFEGFIKLWSKLQSRSLAVQVEMPSKVEPHQKNAIRDYLNNLTENYFKIRIYWGDPNRFLEQLRNRFSKIQKEVTS